MQLLLDLCASFIFIIAFLYLDGIPDRVASDKRYILSGSRDYCDVLTACLVGFRTDY